MPRPFSDIYNSEKFRSLSPDDQDFIIRDYFDTVVSPQIQAKKLAPQDADFIRTDYFNKYKPLTAAPQPQEPNLLNSTFTGLAKGLGRGVTAEGYNPEIAPGEEGAAAVGDFLGAAGVNTLPYLAGPGAGLAVNTIYAGARETNRELNQGKRLDQLNPVAIGGQAALGALTSKLPPAVGRGMVSRVLTGAGMGAATGVSGRAIEQWADTGKVDFTDSTMAQAALFGAGIGGGVGAVSKPRLPKAPPTKLQTQVQEPPIGLKPLRVVEPPQVETKVTGRVLTPEEVQAIQAQPTADVFQLPVGDIQTNTAKFQRRATPFNEEHVNRIASEFDPAKLDPLTVWKDPDTGETLLLSGHHRLEALKRIGQEQAPVKYFEGDLDQARDFATASNALQRPYGDLEMAKIIAEDTSAGKPLQEVAKQLNLSPNKARDVSQLNHLRGDWLEHYERPEVKPYAMTVAKAVNKYGLSDQEQQQLFQFLFQGDNAATVTPSKLNQLIEFTHNYKQTLGGADGEVSGQGSLFDTQVFQQTTGNALNNLLEQSESLNKQLKAIASLQKQLDKVEKSELVQPKTTRILREELVQAQANLEQQLNDIGFKFRKPNQTMELAGELKQTQVSEPVPIRNLKASEQQALEAKAIRKQRRKEEQAGHMLIGGPTRLRSPFEPIESQAFNPETAGVKDPLGSTRQKAGLLEQAKEGLKDKFNYMHAVKGKTWRIGMKKVQGERFIAETDQLRSQLEIGYRNTEGRVKNAIEHLDNTPGYSARQKLDDATRYLLLSDYVRRGKEGHALPEGMTLEEAQGSLSAITAHVRKNPEVRKAVVHVRQLLNEIGQELVKAGILKETRKQYFPHQVLEYLDDKVGLPVSVKYPKRGYTLQAKGSEKAVETDLINALDHHLKAIARHNAIDDFVNRTLREYSLPNWKAGQKLPDGFVEYQPRTGRRYFEAHTIPEKSVMNAVLDNLFGEAPHNPKITVALNQVRKVLAVGGGHKTYAIPDEIARYMNQLYDPKTLEGSNSLISQITRTWKGFVTANPINLPGLMAYNFKNMVGDAEAALRDDPALRQYLSRAWKEIWDAKGGNPSKEFLTAEEWGTIGAGYFGSELGIKGDVHFERRFQNRKLGSKTLSRVGQGIMDLQTAREDLLRYAKFLKDLDHGLEPWQAHIENGKTFINYNHLTDFEKKWFRDSLLPFYTFYKFNLMNWGSAMTGQRGKGTQARALGLAVGVPFMAAIWNNLQFGEIEQEIQENKGERYIAETPHIVTPFKDSKGNHYIILLPTSSAQALQFSGLSRLPQHLVKALTTGNVTDEVKGQISDFSSRSGRKGGLSLPAPMVETMELANPYLKEGAEQLFNWDLYLDRPIAREGEDVPESEKTTARLAHLGKTVFPPGFGPKVQNMMSPHKDLGQKLMDLATGGVKTPDVFSWSDLKEEEHSFQDEQIRVKTPELNPLKEAIKQAKFDEANDLIFNTQFADDGTPTKQGKRYGQLLKPSQRIRVKTLLESVQQGNGLSYKGLLKDLKALDAAYQQAGPEQKKQLDKIKQSILSDLETLKKNRTQRLQYAVQTVLLEDDPKEQNAIFKELTQE